MRWRKRLTDRTGCSTMASSLAVVALLCLSCAVVSSFSCVCSPSECEEVSGEDCPKGGGTVWDPCKCCRVCARVEGEPCGGPHGFFGACAEGLDCVVAAHSSGIPITAAHSEGTCTRRPGNDGDCPAPFLQTGCNIINNQCTCETVHTCAGESPFGFSSRDECEVNLAVMLAHELLDLPSSDVGRNCTGNDCGAESEEEPCPPDSNLDLADGVCVCNAGHCFRPLCKLPGQAPLLKRRATGRPGDCCDVYECAAPHDPDCSEVQCPVEVEVCPDDSYRLPAHMNPHECCATPQVCECYPKACPEPACGEGLRVLVVRKGNGTPGFCCDVFHCLQPNGSCLVGNSIHKNGSSWLNDVASNCTCIHGLVHCNEHVDDPGGCLSVRGELHSNGDTWEDDNCISCTCDRGKKKCKAFMCASCEHPVHVPGECCPRCEGGNVESVPAHCPPVTSLNCTLSCQYGLERDADGCYGCACLPGPNGSCTSSSGATHSDGETWLDGCRQCFCRGGVEMCTLVICPPLNCVKPTFQSSSDCCAACPDSSGNETVAPKAALCYSLDGGYKQEGDSWVLGPCTRCLCHQGQALCETRRCPPTPCRQPVFSPELCCPYCPKKPNASAIGFPCSPLYSHGSTWRRGVCESCTCEDGKTLCYTEHCSVPNCQHPVLAKGQCCSVCIGHPDDRQCHEGNRTFAEGEVWVSAECQQCSCLEGGVSSCLPLDCSTRCGHLPQHCCPSCQEVGRGEHVSSSWYLIIVGAAGILLGVLGVWATTYLKQYCRARHYSVSICPESGCNEAFTSLTKAKYKAGSKTTDATEKAKLTSV